MGDGINPNHNHNQLYSPENVYPNSSYFTIAGDNLQLNQLPQHPPSFSIPKSGKNDILPDPMHNFIPTAYSTPIHQRMPLGSANFNTHTQQQFPPPFFPYQISPPLGVYDQPPVDTTRPFCASYSDSNTTGSSGGSLNATSSSSNGTDSGMSSARSRNSSSTHSPYSPIHKKSKKIVKTKLAKPVFLAPDHDRNEVFGRANGRLGLLGDNPSYDITLGEILRRVEAPETLHVSILNALLRKGKSKDGAEKLRKRLKGYGIDAPEKLTVRTKFTGLIEGEAVRLALDFNNLISQMDTKAIAQQIVSSVSPDDLIKMKQGIDAISCFMMQLMQLYGKLASSPAMMQQPESEAEHTIHTFSLLTHGFGHNAVRGVLEHMHSILFDCSELLVATEQMVYNVQQAQGLNGPVQQVY